MAEGVTKKKKKNSKRAFCNIVYIVLTQQLHYQQHTIVVLMRSQYIPLKQTCSKKKKSIFSHLIQK